MYPDCVAPPSSRAPCWSGCVNASRSTLKGDQVIRVREAISWGESTEGTRGRIRPGKTRLREL